MITTTKQYRYLEIAEALRLKIRNGDWASGERLPSFVEMYQEHGATTHTMQKVYDLLEKEELIERRSRSGVYVTSVARQRQRSGLLALVLPYFFEQLGTPHFMESSYGMRLLRGIHQEAGNSGFQITLGTVEQITAGDYPVAGLLIQGDSRLAEEVARLKKPTVSLISHPPSMSSIGIDDRESSKAITEYLWQQGHRRIAALMGSDKADSENDLISPLRIEGYQDVFAEKGEVLPPEWHRKLHDYTGEPGYVHWGYIEMGRWLREGWAGLNCTAIVAQNDAVAVGVIKALRNHGYRVPQDVSVVGFDNAGNDWQFDLKLTSVEIPLEEIGRQAVTMLRDRIEHPDAPIRTEKLPTKIVEGESTTGI